MNSPELARFAVWFRLAECPPARSTKRAINMAICATLSRGVARAQKKRRLFESGFEITGVRARHDGRVEFRHSRF